LKCHDIGYIEKLKNLCEKIKNESINNTHNTKHNKHDNKNDNNINYNLNCINTNPAFQNSIQNNNHYLFKYQNLDNDTFINEYSYENIYNTTGCVFDAIDLVMKGTVKNAFALIRPPGHHAGYYGPVENPILTSMGFCIVNNVAIGVAYAKYKYKNDINRIAIVDFDVHHGNGTEEIIQMLTGKEFTDSCITDRNNKIFTKTTKKLNFLDFDDPKNILFISTHVYSEEDPKIFYPYTGSTENNTNKESILYPGGILNVPFGAKNNNPKEYRSVLKAKIIPRLYKFKPDLIFISAGFDGHENELINQGLMQLTEFDFAYLTQQIQFVANKFCKGRIISVLEGGYNVSTGLISSFAQSAFVHTRFLNLSINMFYCYDVKLTGVKRKNDITDEIEVFDKFINKGKLKPRRSDRIRHQEDEEYKKDDF
jgi:acetoin utilization deacetylase AcuC-like enzyme